MIMNKPSRIGAGLTLAFAAVLMAGCSSSDGDNSATPPVTPAPTPNATTTTTGSTAAGGFDRRHGGAGPATGRAGRQQHGRAARVEQPSVCHHRHHGARADLATDGHRAPVATEAACLTTDTPPFFCSAGFGLPVHAITETVCRKHAHHSSEQPSAGRQHRAPVARAERARRVAAENAADSPCVRRGWPSARASR